eukprot:9037240-Pyramimonas_sp.AAC.2
MPHMRVTRARYRPGPVPAEGRCPPPRSNGASLLAAQATRPPRPPRPPLRHPTRGPPCPTSAPPHRA